MKFFLFPFALIYFLAILIRNLLFDKNFYKSFQFKTVTINVGNLTVGGTGKTPHIEYLIKFLKIKNKKITTLSRGYGRDTTGFRIANDSDSPNTIGDEPMQFYKKFSPDVSITVGEERAMAIPQIVAKIQETEIILLDDAFQHRSVIPTLNILLTDYNRLFYNDYMLPVGRLRENRRGAKRSDLVIVSKCPADLTNASKKIISEKIIKYCKSGTNIFFTGIHYGKPIPFSNENFAYKESGGEMADELLLVSAIAQPKNFEKQLEVAFKIYGHVIYNDHHQYLQKDIEKIKASFLKSKAKSILTTEKDFVKLSTLDTSGLPFFYLPIEVYFLEEEEKFQEIIMKLFENA